MGYLNRLMIDMAISLAIRKIKELRMNRAAMDMLNEKSRGIVLLIESMLEDLQESVKKVDLRNRDVPDFSVESWIVQVFSMAREIEDIIDGFFWKFDWNELENTWLVCSLLDPVKNAFLGFRVSKQIDQIYSRVERVSAMFVSDVVDDGPPLPLKNWMLFSTEYYSRKMSWQKREDAIIGFEKYFKTLKKKLIGGSDGLEVIHIRGEHGIGKTTLAKKVYNNTEIQKHFEVCIWLHLPLNLNSDDLYAQIRENLLALGLEIEEETSTRSMSRCIYNCLQGKRYFVVVDGILWSTDWASVRVILPNEFNGSRIVTMFRPGGDVSLQVDSIVFLGYLNKDESKGLFCQRAFSSFDWPGEYADISFQDIHDITEGHPLAIVLLSGLLNSQLRPSMWREILTWLSKSFDQRSDTARDMILALSFDNLPNNVKPCFLYFAYFPKGTILSADKLVRLWDAEGFIESDHGGKSIEEIGEGILNELILRQLVHTVRKDPKGRIKEVTLYDLIHDFVRSEAESNEFFEIRTDMLFYPPPMRRLSLRNCVYMDLIFSRRLRSLSCYFEFPREEFSNLSFFRWARFLRVLNIHGLLSKRIPEEIGNMILLRYLGICSRELKELPLSIKNLINLQTLDISGTSVTNLASGFWNIPTLKHVFGSLLVVPPRVGYLVNLLSLKSINCSNWSPASYSVLHYMSHLKSLELRGLLHCDANALLYALGKLEFLEHLILAGNDLPLRLFTISTLSCLETLELHGTLDNDLGSDTVSNMCSNLPLLDTVCLFSSNATQTLVDALALLPNLFIFKMNKAYNGQELNFRADGFYRLKELELVELDELRICRIEASCMPQLERLTLLRCGIGISHVQVIKTRKQMRQRIRVHPVRIKSCRLKRKKIAGSSC